MAKDGVICLSEALPKKADDIEAMMQEIIEENEQADGDDELLNAHELLDEEEDEDDLDLAHG
jgi:hypothetical protein